jgi:hypothetical protein
VHERQPVFQVQVVHYIGRALVQVDRTRMHCRASRSRVDSAQHPAGPVLHDHDLLAARTADVHRRVRPVARGPVPAGGTFAQHTAGDQVAEDLTRDRVAERAEVLFGERDLGGGACQVRAEYIGIERVQNRRLDRPVQHRRGVVY